MPTLCGLRRRGYTPASIRNFCERVGVAKVNSTIEYSFLEHCLREDLNENAVRAMAVLEPLRLTVTNYPEGKTETFENGKQSQPTGRRYPFHHFFPPFVDRKDRFSGGALQGYFRLFPGNEVRLKTAYIVRCTGCRKTKTAK